MSSSLASLLSRADCGLDDLASDDDDDEDSDWASAEASLLLLLLLLVSLLYVGVGTIDGWPLATEAAGAIEAADCSDGVVLVDEATCCLCGL